jgi:DNA-directed RNA polymerase specialized sigma24 family protein
MTAGRREVRTEPFEQHRTHLRSVAYRVLGSLSEADDAVQEAWLRMERTDVSDVRNLRGWLATVVARICLDMLRARSAQREAPLGVKPSPRTMPSTPKPKRSLPTPSAWRCSSSCRPDPGRAARVRTARHVRPAVRRDHADRGPDREHRRATRGARPSPRTRQTRRLQRIWCAIADS